MKIRYEYVTGEVVEIEVPDELGNEMAAIEQAQGNRNRAETRRHASIYALLEKGLQFASNDDPAGEVLDADMRSRIRDAVSQLTVKQREVLRLLYLEGLTEVEAARITGITQQALSLRHIAAIKKLKDIFKDTL